MNNIVICIDGPAASGKTSVSRELAARLGCNWVSTGAFYRGLAYVAVQLKVPLDDEIQLADLAQRRDLWEVRMGPLQTDVVFRGQVITDLLNDEKVGSAASQISHFPQVRAGLLPLQRDCKKPGVCLVAEGRDCGTVVFPHAAVKVFLTARQEDRALRRASELGLSPEETVKAQRIRDQQDSTRKSAPLAAAEDAFVLDSTNLDFQGVVGTILSYVQKRLPNASVERN